MCQIQKPFFAAQIAEFPLHYAAKLMHDEGEFQGCCSGLLGYVCGLVALPISIALTPITIVADIIQGLVGACIDWHKGKEGYEIREMLFKKAICSPIQQIVDLIVKVSLCAFLGLGLIFWPISYICTQAINDAPLSDAINHTEVNIYIGGGWPLIPIGSETRTLLSCWALLRQARLQESLECDEVAEKYPDKLAELKALYTSLKENVSKDEVVRFFTQQRAELLQDCELEELESSNASLALVDSLFQEMQTIQSSDTDGDGSEYANFKKRVLTEVPVMEARMQSVQDEGWAPKKLIFAAPSARRLLNLDKGFTKEQLGTNYRALSRHLHSDKIDRTTESEALFRCLGQAKKILEWQLAS